MELKGLIKKFLVSLLAINLYVAASYANLSCVVNGDFFPFPWSDESVDQVVGEEWPLLNLRNQVESKITIQQLDVYFTKFPIFLVREYALDNRMMGLGTGWQDSDEKAMTFRMYNLSTADRPYDYLTVRYGTWKPKPLLEAPELGVPYKLPIEDFTFPPQIGNMPCPNFMASQKSELFGLIIEKDSTWNAERKDIYFSFDPIRN